MLPILSLYKTCFLQNRIADCPQTDTEKHAAQTTAEDIHKGGVQWGEHFSFIWEMLIGAFIME